METHPQSPYWIIRQGRVVDPTSGWDEVRDLFVARGRVVENTHGFPDDAEVIDARGLTVVPALVDIHTHLREPGHEAAETIASGTRAARAGGFGTVLAMPNTTPPPDNPEAIQQLRNRICQTAHVRVLPCGCITKGRQGAQTADIAALATAGALAFSDDGAAAGDMALVEAMRRAAAVGRVVIEHAQDHAMEKAGVMHEGAYSAAWGLPGIPSQAEVRIVARDIHAAEQTGCALHIQHLSARESLPLIRQAQAMGLRVTAEVTPHHVALCDADINPDDANYKMNPPLRSSMDRQALISAVADGTISCLATDHAPHTAVSKAKGFREAPFGIIGLETAVGITYTELVLSGRMSLLEWLRRWTTGPAAVMGLTAPSLQTGAWADIALLDLDTSWTVQPTEFFSKSNNTPFGGRRLTGRAVRVLLALDAPSQA